MCNIIYQNLSVNDIDLIEPLWEQLNHYHLETVSTFKEDFKKFTFKERKRRLLNSKKKINIIVASEDNNYIAYCISSIDEKGKGEIESLCVNPQYRGKGVGSVLMKKSLTWLEENKAENITILVAVGNEKALSFYEKLGFAPKTYKLKRKP